MTIFPLAGVRGGRSAPSVNLGAIKLKSYTHLDRAKYSFQYENFSARVCGGGAPSVNLGPTHNSKTIRARKLKFTHI